MPHIPPRIGMKKFLQRFIQINYLICRFQRGPQDLPALPLLAWLSLSSYILVNWLLAIQRQDPGSALFLALLDAVLLAGLAWLLLYLAHFTHRATQTITALAGTGTIIESLSWPLLYWALALVDQKIDPSVPALGLLLLGAWRLAILAHIFRHALSTTPGYGLLASIGYLLMAFSILRLVLPEMAK